MKLTIDNNIHIIDEILLFGASLAQNNEKLIYHSTSRLPNHDTIYKFKLNTGSTYFNYQDVSINIIYNVSDMIVGNSMKAVKYHTLELCCERNIDFIQKFMDAAHKFSKVKKEKTEVVTYIFKMGFWNTLSKLPKREKGTLHLPGGLLPEMIKDLEGFLSEKDKYLKYGIPYKRNYLLEGLPGTGKTSLIFILGSHFDMNIAIINFSLSIDDATFMKSVSKLPEDCILVLEDIDALFVERKAGDANKSMVSFSGILNTLDGLARRDKQVTFLTTNYVSKLDSALIRPGRIDKIVTFKNATMGQIKMFYDKFLPNGKEAWPKFKKSIRGIKTTAAILQSFFFKYIDCDNILDHVEKLKELSREKMPAGCELMYL